MVGDDDGSGNWSFVIKLFNQIQANAGCQSAVSASVKINKRIWVFEVFLQCPDYSIDYKEAAHYKEM